MRRFLRRLLGLGPTIAEQHRAGLSQLGRAMAYGLAEGVRDPRALTPEEMARVMAYGERVARRSFSALYDDKD